VIIARQFYWRESTGTNQSCAGGTLDELRKPQVVEISKTASKKLNPIVVGFTCSQRRKSSTIPATINT